MKNEKVQELIAAWALDATSPAENMWIEKVLATDEHLAHEARMLQETVALLAESGAASPPADLLKELLSLISITKQDTSKRTSSAAQVPEFSNVPLWLSVAKSAAVSIVSGEEPMDHAQLDVQVASLQLTQGRAAIVGAENIIIFATKHLPFINEGIYHLWESSKLGTFLLESFNADSRLNVLQIDNVPGNKVFTIRLGSLNQEANLNDFFVGALHF